MNIDTRSKTDFQTASKVPMSVEQMFPPIGMPKDGPEQTDSNTNKANNHV